MREELQATPTEFNRYLMNEIPWEDRMIGILGPRGVGKSIRQTEPETLHTRHDSVS